MDGHRKLGVRPAAFWLETRRRSEAGHRLSISGRGDHARRRWRRLGRARCHHFRAIGSGCTAWPIFMRLCQLVPSRLSLRVHGHGEVGIPAALPQRALIGCRAELESVSEGLSGVAGMAVLGD